MSVHELPAQTTTGMSGHLLTVNEAAEEYPVSRSQLRHLIAERRIPFFRMVGLSGRPFGIRLDRRDLNALFTRVEPIEHASLRV